MSEDSSEAISRCHICEHMIELNKESYTTVQVEEHPVGIEDGFFLCGECNDALWRILGVEPLG